MLWLKDFGAGAALVLFIGSVFALAHFCSDAALALRTFVFGG
jgi:hypothetical protein